MRDRRPDDKKGVFSLKTITYSAACKVAPVVFASAPTQSPRKARV
jgi:hypothetical protein